MPNHSMLHCVQIHNRVKTQGRNPIRTEETTLYCMYRKHSVTNNNAHCLLVM